MIIIIAKPKLTMTSNLTLTIATLITINTAHAHPTTSKSARLVAAAKACPVALYAARSRSILMTTIEATITIIIIIITKATIIIITITITITTTSIGAVMCEAIRRSSQLASALFSQHSPPFLSARESFSPFDGNSTCFVSHKLRLIHVGVLSWSSLATSSVMFRCRRLVLVVFAVLLNSHYLEMA